MIKNTLLIAALILSPFTLGSIQEQAEAAKVLDTLHSAAAKADWPTYFAIYTDNAVFLGTAAEERWNMDEFRRYALPTNGWDYKPQSRQFIEHGDTLLFDEILYNDKYGHSRGTGAMIKTNKGWQVLQYHLSFPVPNEVAKEVTGTIMAFEKQLMQKK
ncbi:nuclear transport factor 2 family protein [Shewanella sp.]|uniref:nuclear transport factor 2 family protein n=1 Tax=Shewanella sp. TaxID=50422 RepID=UPI00356502E1